MLIRGGGDLASGVAYRLLRCGIACLITELEHPLSVRRLVSFSSAVHIKKFTVEGITAQLVHSSKEAFKMMDMGRIPVMVDPDLKKCMIMDPALIVDARMLKKWQSLADLDHRKIIGLGPGFIAGENCRVVIETNRGAMLGRVIQTGRTEPNSGIPERVYEHTDARVLRAPVDGILKTRVHIADHIHSGEVIAEIAGEMIAARFTGILRGLLPDGTQVSKGMKIGDLDPRDRAELADHISEKALAIGGGVLEALLSDANLRKLFMCGGNENS